MSFISIWLYDGFTFYILPQIEVLTNSLEQKATEALEQHENTALLTRRLGELGDQNNEVKQELALKSQELQIVKVKSQLSPLHVCCD